MKSILNLLGITCLIQQYKAKKRRDKMQTQYLKLCAERRDLSIEITLLHETQTFGIRYDQIVKRIREIDWMLHEIDRAIGRNPRGIGNYSTAVAQQEKNSNFVQDQSQ